jgi:hypothetical protein
MTVARRKESETTSNGESHFHIHWPEWPVPGNTEVLSRLDAIQRQLTAIQQKERTMATQADIDALASRLSTAVQGIQTEIETLKSQAAQQGTSLDFTSLERQVSAVEGLEMPPAATDAPPADAPPADAPPAAP